MKAWTYFHEGQLLMESDNAIQAAALPDNVYLYVGPGAFPGRWCHLTTEKFHRLDRELTRGFFDVKEEDVPKEYRMWLLIL